MKWIYDSTEKHPPFVKLVPLIEIIAESLSALPASLKVRNAFSEMCEMFGSEINVLLKTEIPEIAKYNEKIAQGLQKVRTGDIVIKPGFDGEYGKVEIWSNEELSEAVQKKDSEEQLGLF